MSVRRSRPVEAQRPASAALEQARPARTLANSTHRFCGRAENVTATDDNGTPGDSGDDQTFLAGDASGDDGDGILNPGETWIFVFVSTVLEGQFTNIASVVADVPGGGQVDDNDNASYIGATGPITALEIVKIIDGFEDGDVPTLLVDTPVTFRYFVTNTGTVTIGEEDTTILAFFDDNGTPGDTSDDILIDPAILVDDDGFPVGDDNK